MTQPAPLFQPDGIAIHETVADLRHHVSAWRRQGSTVALVPTMGALHDGHLALVRRAKECADRVVASIFVNPTQFSAHEDLEAYPRREADDIAALAKAKVDALFLPSVAEMYPPGFATSVRVTGVSDGLCAAARPDHFAGVAVVVTKLLLQAQPDFALFGEKDYQQLQVIRRLVCDLDIPVTIIGVPTVREADGLAMSSRNAYLTPAERQIAPQLHRILDQTAARLAAGVPFAELRDAATAHLLGVGFQPVDYIEFRDADDLSPLDHASRPGRLLAAARLGRTRLIDNVPVPISR
jgi:pantoate--beta-alanine ligase